MKSRAVAIATTVALLALGLPPLALFLICSGAEFLVETPFYLFCGWWMFLARVIPKMTPDWPTAGMGLAAAVLFAGGLHWTLRSLCASLQPPQAWRARWTAAAIVAVGVAFASGLCAVGLVQQHRWLRNAPMLYDNVPERHLSEIAYHLKQSAELPAGMTIDERGAALHGWQTQLLPHLDQNGLFAKIDLSRPWTDARNHTAFATPVEDYQIDHHRLPQRDKQGYALSHYAANVHVFGGTQRRLVETLSDKANTILVGEAAGNFKPWGHPRNWRDPALGINTSADGFGGPWPGGALLAYADGSVRYVNDKVDAEVLRAVAAHKE